MTVKFSTLKSRLKHSPDFDAEIGKFLKDIENNLSKNLVEAQIDDYDCDLKLIFVQTGGSEGLFLENFSKLQPPYYILTNGSNNSLASSLEILTFLNKIGAKGEILHGSAQYIAKRIQELSVINRAKRKINGAKLGVIGKPSNWLIASVPDYDEIKNKFNITLKDIPLEEIESKCLNEREHPHEFNDFDKKEINKALDIYDAIKETVNLNRLNGITIRCFDLLSSLRSTGCLALAKLNDEGMIGTCEGDVMAMISMLVANALTNQSTFQANPSRIDVEKNTIVFAHCTLPLGMTKGFRLDTHFESGIGVAIKGKLRKERITVFRMSADLKSYFVSNGEIIDNLNEPNLCRTQIEVHLDKDVSTLLKTPCGNHHIIMYGEWANAIDELMRELL